MSFLNKDQYEFRERQKKIEQERNSRQIKELILIRRNSRIKGVAILCFVLFIVVVLGKILYQNRCEEIEEYIELYEEMYGKQEAILKRKEIEINGFVTGGKSSPANYTAAIVAVHGAALGFHGAH